MGFLYTKGKMFVPILTILGTLFGDGAMKRNWELDELIEHFTLMPQEMRLVGNKTGETRLGFSVMLKYFQHEGRFPNHRNEVPNTVVAYIAK